MTPSRLLITALAIAFSVMLSVEIRRHAEGERPAILAQIAAHEATMRLPYADVTIETPQGLPRILVGVEQIMVETAHRSPPAGTSAASREWWKEHRDDAPVVIEMGDGRFVADDLKGQLSVSLYDALLDIAESQKSLGEVSGDRDDEFRGAVVIALDRRVPWDTLISVLYTSGQAQFSEFSLVVAGGESVEYGMTSLINEPAITIEPNRLLVSWFRGNRAVAIPCIWGCQEALSDVLARMSWHYPHHHGGVIFADRDTPLSRVFSIHRQLARGTAMLSIIARVGRDTSRLTTVSAMLSEGEPLHALMETHRQTAERISVGPIRIESTQPMRWRSKLERVPGVFKQTRNMAGPADQLGPNLGANDIRACLLPALIAEPARSGALEVTVRMTGESIYAVHTPWEAVQTCLSRRLFGRSLSSSWGGFFGMPKTIDTSRATARVTVTIAEAP